jgi:hypothetical protein
MLKAEAATTTAADVLESSLLIMPDVSYGFELTPFLSVC